VTAEHRAVEQHDGTERTMLVADLLVMYKGVAFYKGRDDFINCLRLYCL